jgi:hypothetical protein
VVESQLAHILEEELPVSAPSRRPEIRRRRRRHEKVVKLRKRLANALDPEKKRVAEKLHRLELGSPGNPLAR